MSAILLCIDDEPNRYQRLARLLPDDITLVVTHQIQDVMFYLDQPEVYTVAGVCLDCDMPNSPQGLYYATHILNEKNIPVVISSHNPGEALKCHEMLNDYATPNIVLPVCDDDGWAQVVINFILTGR